MSPRSAEPTDAPTPAAQRRRDRSARAERPARDEESSLARAALAFAVRAHAGQRRDSDGAAFIEHPVEVARLLRAAGCSEELVAAGLLHDVTSSGQVSPAELTERFGPTVANLVAAVGNTASVHSYRRRKQVLREQVRNAGRDAAMLFAADRISRLREFPARVARDRARFEEAAPGSRVRDQLAYFEQLRLEHFQRSLRMLRDVAPGHPLVEGLADELKSWRRPSAATSADLR